MTKIIIPTFILFFSSILSGQAQESIPPSYGAPYYNTSHYPYGGHPGNTVSEAIDNWWSAYQAYWHVSSCSYILTTYDTGATTGVFAHMRLINGCGGGDSIVGTAFCNAGYFLTGGQCVSMLEKDKNLGSPPCQ